MKLTEKKLRRIIKEEMLNEFMGFGKKKVGAMSKDEDMSGFLDFRDLEGQIKTGKQQDLANKKLEEILTKYIGKPKWVFVSPEHEHSYAIVQMDGVTDPVVLVLKNSFIGTPKIVAMAGMTRRTNLYSIKKGLEKGDWVSVFRDLEDPAQMNMSIVRWAQLIKKGEEEKRRD